MLLAVVVLILVFLITLSIASLTRRMLTATFFLVALLAASFVGSATRDTYSAAASWVLIFLCGVLIESIKDTVLLLKRAARERRAARQRRTARQREAARAARQRSRIAA